MTNSISPLADVHPSAVLGTGVEIGPFCRVDKHVTIGDETSLQSHVVITGHTTIGSGNEIHPHTVIGGPPQDHSYRDSPTRVVIGNDNVIREGVTINRGAEKEDHTTRIGNGNLLMANSHIAHNCHLRDGIILVNGVLLGGHVHVHDGAIVSGNSVVHHFSTLGTLSFVSGGCRVPHDIPPYMLACGSDNPTIRTINIVGLRRRGVSEPTISSIKLAHRLLFRNNKPLDQAREQLLEELDGLLPLELSMLLTFVENQRRGKLGRAREAIRDTASDTGQNNDPPQEKAA